MKKFVSNEDLRIIKTRKSLYNSLTSLILKKGYDSIIVQDILDHAHIGRSTFYSHYADKDELLISGIDQLKEHLANLEYEKLKVNTDPFPFSFSLFEHAEEFRPVYKALLMSQARSIVNNHFQEMLTELILKNLALKKSIIPADLLATTLASTFINVLIWWMNHKMKLSPKEVNRIFSTLASRLV